MVSEVPFGLFGFSGVSIESPLKKKARRRSVVVREVDNETRRDNEAGETEDVNHR
jgi:hypothetical protein